MTPAARRSTRPTDDPRRRPRRSWARRAVAATAVLALPVLAMTTASATTAVVTTNSGGLTAVGPVNTEYGFPAWYQDKSGTRVELCLDGNDPMCGFVGAPVAGFDNTQPAVFPTNFPDEAFYFLGGSTLTLPNGGKATLTLGLEAAFLNAVQNGDQITFARQRIFVTGGPANTTLHFHQPYGDIDIDVDASGRGRLTEDIAPSVGNFTTPLKGNLGPFLTATGGPITTPSGTYLGDPAVPTTVTGGPKGNLFSVDYTDPTSGATHAQTDQFTVQGKISTNTGFDGTNAVLTPDGAFVDVFADSKADGGEIFVAADQAAGIPSTPLVDNGADGAKSFYARVPVTGTAPKDVTLSNIGDSPTSTIKVAVTKASPITVTDAHYDGKTLHVAAASTNTQSTLTVKGFTGPSATLANGVADIVTGAPPASATVTDGTTSASAPVRVTGGSASQPGEPPVPPSATPPAPVCTVLDPDDPTGTKEIVGPCPSGGPAPTATPTANVAPVTTPVTLGDSVALDASGSTNATSYEWTYKSGPQVTLTNGTTAKPSVKLTPYDVSKYTSANLPKAAQTAPVVLSVVAVNGVDTATATAPRSAPVEVTIPVRTDAISGVTTRYRAGNEYRIDGTSAVPGGSLVLNPPTTVAVYNRTSGKLVGTAQVDTTGAFSLRLRSPFPAGQDLAANIALVSSRGGYATATVAGAPN